MIAVLEKNLGLKLSDKDIYISVAGGFKISETGCDLAVAAAIISSIKNVDLPKSVFVGELGLSGEIRKPSNIDKRVKEASRFGFTQIYVPEVMADKSKHIRELADVKELGKLF